MAMMKRFSLDEVKVINGDETSKIMCAKCGTQNKVAVAVFANSQSSCHKCGSTLEETCQSQS